MAKATASQIVLDRSTKALQTAAATLAKTVADIGSLAGAADAAVLRIEDLNAQADELEAKNTATRRQADAELRLRMVEDADKVLAELLSKGKLARITAADLAALQAELAAKNAADDKELKTAVAVAVNAAQREAATVALQKAAEVSVAVAQKDAEINVLKEKVSFLTSQIAQKDAQIEAERAARVTIAQAESQRQGVTVNNGK